jgi:hypothetical protein
LQGEIISLVEKLEEVKTLRGFVFWASGDNFIGEQAKIPWCLVMALLRTVDSFARSI